MADAIFDLRAEPSAATLDGLLVDRSDLWRELTGRIEEMGGRGMWTCGGPRYGGVLKFKRGVKPFATLTPKPDDFVPLIVLGKDEVGRVDPRALGSRIRRTFEDARQLPDGRWLFHTIESAEDVADATALLEIKLPPTVRTRLAAARQA